MLLEHAADVNMLADDGQSALIAAAAHGHTELAKLLKEHGGSAEHEWMGLREDDVAVQGEGEGGTGRPSERKTEMGRKRTERPLLSGMPGYDSDYDSDWSLRDTTAGALDNGSTSKIISKSIGSSFRDTQSSASTTNRIATDETIRSWDTAGSTSKSTGPLGMSESTGPLDMSESTGPLDMGDSTGPLSMDESIGGLAESESIGPLATETLGPVAD